jgi:hypothetical protein
LAVFQLHLSPYLRRIKEFTVNARFVVRRVAIVILIGFFATLAGSAARAELTAAPTTAPAGDEVQSLVAKLGDADFRIRRDASNRLREIGVAALPALKQAAEDGNPEVRSRAAQIVRTLEYHHVPGPPTHQNRTRISSVSLRIINGKQAIDLNDEGRQIRIVTKGSGIEMTVTGETDGHPATETYKADSPEQLKSENPEAFALYDRCSRRIGVEEAAGMPGNLILRGQGNIILVPQVQPMPFIRAGGDDLGALRDRLEQQMVNLKLAPDKKQQVEDAIDKVAQSMNFNAAAGGQADDRIAVYDKACDDLRKLLSDLNLPDPGDALPPPKGARLGVSVQPDIAAGGIAISHVVANSRADRIGLQSDDVIRKINGNDVEDVKQLRRLVTDHPKDLVLDITRDGREIRLQEKEEPESPPRRGEHGEDGKEK